MSIQGTFFCGRPGISGNQQFLQSVRSFLLNLSRVCRCLCEQTQSKIEREFEGPKKRPITPLEERGSAAIRTQAKGPHCRLPVPGV